MLDISFPSGEQWDRGSPMVIFQASVSTNYIPCAISLEALQDLFNGDLRQPLETFRQHRPTIENLARKLIQGQRFEPDGSVLIRSQDR